MKYVALDRVAIIDRTVASEEECETLPYVGLDHIEKDAGHFTADFEREPEILRATKFRFTPKHILYGKLRPYLNKVALPSFDGICTTEILPILPVEDKLDRTYLWAFLLTPEFVEWASSNVSGANLPRISPKLLAKYELPLPPLPEQKRIAAILAKADRLRRLRRTAGKLSDTYLQSVFLEMFGDPVSNPMGWEYELLDDICSLVRGSSPRPQGDPRYFGGPVPRLMIADITRDGIFVTPSIDSLTEEGAKKSRPMKASDVVMAVSGAVGLPAILKVDACIHDGFVGFRKLDDKLLPVFFAYLLTTLRAASQSQATGAIWQNLTTDQIKMWRVMCPPQSLQQQFAQIVCKFESLRAQQREAERQAEHLFQTLLHRAFRGEV